MIGYTRITKEQFYAKGGFSNPRLVRREESGSWAYYERAD
jgi:hypothetical protein